MDMEVDITGLRKTAILLIALGPDISSQILKELPDRQIQKISYEIANTEYVRPEEKEAVIQEFIEMATARQYFLDGGFDYAKDLLQKALGPKRANELIDMLTQIQQRERPFAIARKADPKQLTNLLVNEHPQTIALIMCYLQPEKAATVLAEFPIELQSEVAQRIGSLSGTSPQIISKIENIMEDKFANFIERDTEVIGGVPSLVDILNSVDRGTEKNILNMLEESQPELAAEVKANLFVFEDLIGLDKTAIQTVLRNVSNDDLVLAIKGSTEEVAEILYDNMSKRAADLIREEIEFMGPVRLSAVEEAQKNIVAVVRTLDEAGEIIMKRGDQDSVIV